METKKKSFKYTHLKAVFMRKCKKINLQKNEILNDTKPDDCILKFILICVFNMSLKALIPSRAYT